MSDSIRELFEFLDDERLEVRSLAMEHVSGLTSAKDQFELFKADHFKYLYYVMEHISDDPVVANKALSGLINLSADVHLATAMGSEVFLRDLIVQVILPKNINADLCCMLLNNLSKYEPIANSLLPVHQSQEATPPSTPSKQSESTPAPVTTHRIDNLLEIFTRGEAKTYNSSASFHFLAGVFANLSSSPQGCEFFLGKSTIDGTPRLSKVSAFVEHPEVIRRGGCISTIKNCCYGVNLAQGRGLDILLAEEEDMNLLVTMLLPLSGPEEYTDDEMEGMPLELQLFEPTKKREADPVLRLMLVECILLLCGTRTGRDILRANKVYPVLQKLHLQEKDEEISERIERIVNMLMRDEQEEKAALAVSVPEAKDGTVEEVMMTTSVEPLLD